MSRVPKYAVEVFGVVFSAHAVRRVVTGPNGE